MKRARASGQGHLDVTRHRLDKVIRTERKYKPENAIIFGGRSSSSKKLDAFRNLPRISSSSSRVVSRLYHSFP